MNRFDPLLMLVAMLAWASATFAADVVVPNAHLKADSIPPIPAELAARVAPYTEFKPASVADWHPHKRELIIARRAGDTTQLHRIAAPGSEPRQLTAFSEPVRFGTYLAAKPDALIFSRDTGGNEQRQIYRLDAPDAGPVLLTDRGARTIRKHSRTRAIIC